MKVSRFTTPILLLVFNRPDYVARQVELLRKIRPKYLFISGDGPREGSSQDVEAQKEKKRLVTQIDWKCELRTNFRRKNVGCKRGVSGGITWFFGAVQEGIILEDDCFPDPSFFPYCSQLLAKYRRNKKVWHISGANFFERPTANDSYRFSKFPHCWGWATWKRCWDEYDGDIEDWPRHKISILSSLTTNRARAYWERLFTGVYEEKIDTWDYQWIYLIWKRGGLSIIPKKNLVSNIGFDARATHTRIPISPLARRGVGSLDFPLRHPRSLKINEKLDQEIQASFDSHILLKAFSGIKRVLM